MKGAGGSFSVLAVVFTTTLATVAAGQETRVSWLGQTFRNYTKVQFPGQTGDVAFDSSDEDAVYVLQDDAVDRGGGIYQLAQRSGVPTPERILPIDLGSSLAFSPDGDLWIVRDFSPVGSAHLLRVAAPRLGPPYTVENVIHQFLTPQDDDPTVVRVAPPGFRGVKAQGGEIIIGDRGADSNSPNALYLYDPATGAGDPHAYDIFLVPPEGLSTFRNNDLNDFAFSADGSMIYAVFALGQIAKLSPDGTFLGELIPDGITFSRLDAIAVRPTDGRIWVADDMLDEIWSIDPETGAVRREIAFFINAETQEGEHIDFHDPSMEFSPSGEELYVSDARGTLWIFTTEEWFRRGDVDGDGLVNVADPINAFNFMFGTGDRPRCFDAADVNDQLGLNVADPIYLFNYLMGGGPPPAPPGPYMCGPDPTLDDLPPCEYPGSQCEDG